MKIIYGNLIELALNGKFDVIPHGCNCYCVMGKGFARQVKQTFPEAYKVDCSTIKGDKSKLCTITYADVIRNNHKITIINAYTQFDYRFKKVNVDYNALRSCMKIIKNDFSGKRIGYPLIGAGLAEGDWKIISKIIDEELNGEDHTLVKLG